MFENEIENHQKLILTPYYKFKIDIFYKYIFLKKITVQIRNGFCSVRNVPSVSFGTNIP